VHADTHPDTHPSCGQLLQHLEVHLVRLPAAAVLLVERQREQSGAAQEREHIAREAFTGLVVRRAGSELLGSDLTDEAEQVVRLGRRQEAIDRHSGPRRVGGRAELTLPAGQQGRSRRSVGCLAARHSVRDAEHRVVE
jgi:hypothetical protein